MNIYFAAIGRKKSCWRIYSVSSQPQIIRNKRVLTAFLCRKPSLVSSGLVTKNSDKLWWTKFCSSVLNLLPDFLSHFPQPSQWHCGHCTRQGTEDSICCLKWFPEEQQQQKHQKGIQMRKEIIPKIRTFLEICGKSIRITLKVIRADMRMMLMPTQILCLSFRLMTRITKDLDK